MSDLPQGWEDTTLKEITRRITDGSHAPPKGQPSGLPMLSAKNVANGGLDFDAPRWIDRDAFEKEDQRTTIRADDILLTIVGAIGRSTVVPEDVPHFTVQRSVSVIKPVEIDPRFLSFQFRSPVFQLHLEENAKGTAQKGVYLRTLGESPIKIAPVSEQRRIVGKIEALQERSRNAREALAEVGPLLEQFRQSLLAAAFRGDLTADWRAANPNVEPATELLTRIRQERRQKWEQAELVKYEAKGKQPPKGWKEKYKEPEPSQPEELTILHDESLPDDWLWAPAELIVEPDADIVYGIVQPGKKLDDGVPYVRGKDIVDGVILVDQLLKTSEKIAAKYERASLKGGDILLGIIRATKVAIVPDDLEGANITQGTARFRPSSIIRTKFLAGWLDSPFAQNWLHEHYRGIDMPGLNLRDVRRLPIPIAPLHEQMEVEKKVAAAIGSVVNAKLEVAVSDSDLTQLDQSILAKAFRGELVPQDPNDEPASVLLERIRAARESHAAAKKNRKQSTHTRSKKKAKV